MNAGSSSVKFALFGAGFTALGAGMVSEIGPEAVLRFGGQTRAVVAPDHQAAVAACLAALEGAGFRLRDLTAAAHRVVHGGRALTRACRIDAGIVAQIEACVPLAPLHNPGNLAAIRALAALAPDLPQFASFDTAFHAHQPEVAARYALPAKAEALGLRRYGFHGISYAGLVASLDPLPRRLLALHLGNGASLCAVLEGRSVATTMGYSPLDGLTMGTRAGAIDGNAVLRLAEVFGIDGAGRILNRESGLLALGGASDMRGLDPQGFARDHFAYWAIRHAGSMIAAMGGLDAMAFTGGIGENDADMRQRIIAGLAYMGKVAVHVVQAAEEALIARDAAALMTEGTTR